MKSKILMKEKVKNKERKFGSNLEYYPCKIVFENGDEIPALFTENQIKIAILRAENNLEDIPEDKKSLLS